MTDYIFNTDEKYALTIVGSDGKPERKANGDVLIFSKSEDKESLETKARINNNQMRNKYFYKVIEI